MSSRADMLDKALQKAEDNCHRAKLQKEQVEDFSKLVKHLEQQKPEVRSYRDIRKFLTEEMYHSLCETPLGTQDVQGITLGKTLLKDTTTGLYGSINLLRAYTVNGEGTGVFLFSYLTFFSIPKSDATAYRIVLPIDGTLTEEKMRLSIKGLAQRITIVNLSDEQIKVIEKAQTVQMPEKELLSENAGGKICGIYREGLCNLR